MNKVSNTANHATNLTEQKLSLLKSGKVKLNPVDPYTRLAPTPTPISPMCFLAGSLVLMADMSWKAIEQVKAGELMHSINGPVKCVEEHVTRLGNRLIITFDGSDLFWSEEHAFWTRDLMGDEWWWSYNADTWRQEVNAGVIGGLLDNYSIRSGEIALEYAHMDGWKLQKSQVAVGEFNEDTPLFLPVTHGAPIIVNGYLVGAGVNERNFDYKSIKWENFVIQYKESMLVESY
jgi:hypothetical protein